MKIMFVVVVVVVVVVVDVVVARGLVSKIENYGRLRTVKRQLK